MKRHTAEAILTSRLLVMQSKRLMLSSVQRRIEQSGYDALKVRVAELRYDAQAAEQSYRSSMLAWGSPENPEYWLVAYSRLIEVSNTVVTRMREAVQTLPASERYQLSADVEALEQMVDRWTDSMRGTMSAAVA